MDTTKRIKGLVKQLNQYRDEYYNQNNPSVEDRRYDDLFDELKSLESETGCILSNSPTQTVGYAVVSELSKVKHDIPLLSLDKTKAVDDIDEFIGNKKALLMLKYDGLTCECIYDGGVLIEASSRGDGYEGEDITHNAKTFKNLPLTIPNKGYLKVAGEAIIHSNDFDKINNSLTEEEKKKLPKGKYSTCRNLVAGSVRQLNSKICAKRNVYFYPWDVLKGLNDNSRDYNLQTLVTYGFEEAERIYYNQYDSNPQNLDLDFVIEGLKCHAQNNNIPIDGLVVKYDDIKYSKSLGSTSHHNNDGLALKFEDEKEDTVLREIEWSIGRTGQLTPVAIFDTVELDGTEVSRASLHNISIIEKLQLGIGDTVSIAKMNMIIPQIVENKTKSNNIAIPSSCPICGGVTEITQDNDSKVLVCSNPNCSGKLLGKFVHFGSKPAMNIDGMSEATLEKFINKGWLKSFSDIYKLDQYKSEIIRLEGFGQKSYIKLWTAIQNSRNIKLENLLAALGIPLIGRTASKVISKKFDGYWCNLEIALMQSFDFTTLQDFGQTMHDSIYKWYCSEEFKDVDELLKYLMFIVPQNNVDTEIRENPFKGKKIYGTGSFANYKKEELKSLLESFGAEFASGYTKSLDYLIVGSLKGSSKEDKAKRDGIRILSEEEFIDMIGGINI